MARAKVRLSPLIAGWLAVLLMVAANFGAAFLHLGAAQLPVAFLISGVSLVLVALLCMKLASAPTLAVIFAGAGICWWLVMLTMGSSDYATRASLPVLGYQSQLAPR